MTALPVNEFQDIHDALGIAPNTVEAISNHPVLQMDATANMQRGASPSYGLRDRPTPATENALTSPSAENFNRLTEPEQRDYMSRIFFSDARLPYSTLSKHMRDLLGEDAGTSVLYNHGDATGNWMDHWERSAGPATPEMRNALLSGQAPGASLTTARTPGEDAMQRIKEMVGNLTPRSTAPELDDTSIARALAQNPGASIADIAGVRQSPSNYTRAPSQQPEMTSGPLGDLPANVRSRIMDQISPHMDEKEFTDKFFGGMYHPDDFSAGDGSISADSYGRLNFEGRLRDPNTGQNIGSINRVIDPANGMAYHGYLQVKKDARGTGLVPGMLSNQIDLYKQMGLNNVQLSANIDVGSYAWAKYGFAPKTPEDWDFLRRNIKNDFQSMQSGANLHPDVVQGVKQILDNPDPHAIWDLSDITHPAPAGWQRTPGGDTTIGQALLMNRNWPGKLDLHDDESMDRFNDYVRSKMK